MTHCEYCGKEIGLLAVRYTWLDKEKTKAVHDACLEKYTLEKTPPQPHMHHQSEDNTLGILDCITLHGLIDQQYNLIFTKEKIIGQYVGGNTVAFLAGGVLGMVMMDSINKKKALGMTEGTDPEWILASNQKNFSISYTNIEGINIHGRKLKLFLHQKQTPVGNKASFLFPADRYHDIEALLMKSMPDKEITHE